MTRRLATICLMTIFLIGLTSLSVQAQASNPRVATLKGISAIFVLVEDLPNAAKVLGLTEDAIQTDVELKLRLAGMRVVTRGEMGALPGQPDLYIEVNLTRGAEAASIDVELQQNALLPRNGQLVPSATTWSHSGAISAPTAQVIRDMIKDFVDTFLNAWLSVNPKK
jgi:hypothetical protein